MSDTPRTDAAWKPDGGDGYPTVDVDVARQLERELNEANEKIRMLEHDQREFEAWLRNERVDNVLWLIRNCEHIDNVLGLIKNWRKAKEEAK
jgi:hypothetical protein